MSNALIADDSAFMRAIIRRVLEREGFVIVSEAESGIDCIEKYKEHQPELVTLDVTMPSMDGLEALNALIQINPAVRVIMVSALGQEGIVKEAISNGAKTFIVKPFKDALFASVLRKVMAG